MQKKRKQKKNFKKRRNKTENFLFFLFNYKSFYNLFDTIWVHVTQQMLVHDSLEFTRKQMAEGFGQQDSMNIELASGCKFSIIQWVLSPFGTQRSCRVLKEVRRLVRKLEDFW